jgi:hypothetical protein
MLLLHKVYVVINSIEKQHKINKRNKKENNSTRPCEAGGVIVQLTV